MVQCLPGKNKILSSNTATVNKKNHSHPSGFTGSPMLIDPQINRIRSHILKHIILHLAFSNNKFQIQNIIVVLSVSTFWEVSSVFVDTR